MEKEGLDAMWDVDDDDEDAALAASKSDAANSGSGSESGLGTPLQGTAENERGDESTLRLLPATLSLDEETSLELCSSDLWLVLWTS